jgi:hypothetical protein
MLVHELNLNLLPFTEPFCQDSMFGGYNENLYKHKELGKWENSD